MTSFAVGDFYRTENATGWLSIVPENVLKTDQADKIATDCISRARVERIKSISWTAAGLGVSFLVAEVAYVAFAIASFVSFFIFLPLILVPPFHKLAVLLTASVFGVGVAVKGVQHFAKPFFERANSHWRYGDHLYLQNRAAIQIKNRLAAPAA